MHVVIIGSGIAGMSAARRIRQLSDHCVTVVSDEAPFHFSRPAMMYVSKGQLTSDQIKPYPDAEWERLGVTMLQDRVLLIDAASRACHLASGTSLQADKIILATGSEPIVPEINCLASKAVITYTRFSDIARLEYELSRSRIIAIVGGGLIGSEVAEILHAKRKPFSWFIREEGVYRSHLSREESDLITSHITSFGVNIHLNEKLERSETLLNCELVVMCTGVKPRTELAQLSAIHCDDGICVNDRFETDIPGIYAVGDCAQTPWGTDQRWYAGKEHGEFVAEVICGNTASFVQSVYCNSAKFFDLEWQVFGVVPASGVNTIYRTDDERCVRFAFDERGVLIGLQTLGIRLRQSICEDWIRRKVPVEDAMKNFSQARFDPEFTSRIAL